MFSAITKSRIRRHLGLTASARLDPAEFARTTLLTFRGDEFDDEGAAIFTASNSGLTALISLDKGTTLGDAGVTMTRTARPPLKVKD